MGFKQAFEYLLDLLCFAYYVKHDNLVSDHTFDDLERLYEKMFKKEGAPMRAVEFGHLYTRGVHTVYDWFKKEVKK